MSYRLTPRQRIRHRRDFKILFDTGKKAKGDFLFIWALKRPEETKPALAIMVSRKTAARAVKRNLWKRRIREAFRLMQNRILPGTAVLIQARRQEEVPDYRKISEELEKLIKKTGFQK